MEALTTTTKNKKIIIEVLILVAVLGGLYYLYTVFSQEEQTATAQANPALLGPNFINFINITTKDKILFKNKTFLKQPLVEMLVDYSEIISPNATRGRLDPFVPYASSRPIR